MIRRTMVLVMTLSHAEKWLNRSRYRFKCWLELSKGTIC